MHLSTLLAMLPGTSAPPWLLRGKHQSISSCVTYGARARRCSERVPGSGAKLQRHGLGGVQDRHYDRHHYMQEKRAALLNFAKRFERLKAEHVARGRVDSVE